MPYDVVIIGSGPAGLTAAIYAIRSSLNTLVISGRMPGGQLTLTTDVEDFPGFVEPIKGPELMDLMRRQAERLKVEFLNTAIEKVDFRNKPFRLWSADKKQIESKTVIIATGGDFRLLGIPSEKKFLGKGVSTCAVCLTPDSEIITNPDVKSIYDVTEKDKVLTHLGKFEKCVVKGSSSYQGKILKVKTSFFCGELKLTPGHEVLAAKRFKGYYYRKFLTKRKSVDWIKELRKFGFEPKWIPAGMLSAGDFIFYPTLRTLEDKKHILLSDFIDCKVENGFAYTKNQTHTSVNVPDKIPVNADFMRLAGYYIAEGSGGKQLNFYFNRDEVVYINDVKDLIKNLFDLEVNLQIKGSVANVQIFSQLLGRLFKTLFGGYSFEKHLPQWMLYLPIEKQEELFKGMWRGDGAVKRLTFHYVTTSKLLAEQLKIILLRMGIIPKISVKTVEHQNRVLHKIGDRVIVAKHNKYELEIGGPWLKRASEVLEVAHPLKRTRYNYFAWFDQDYAIIPIKSIEEMDYNGLVYNLAVEGDNSYATPTACVHNCDGFFFKDKDVAVIGGGDTAMREALYLAGLCKSVAVIHRRDKLRAQPILQERAFANKKIKFIWNSEVKEIIGKEFVNGIKILNNKTNKIEEIKIDGIFIAIGHKPNSELFRGQLELDEKGYIVIKEGQQTSVKGVYAAGDIHDYTYMQAITAAGAGCRAAIDAYRFLKED